MKILCYCLCFLGFISCAGGDKQPSSTLDSDANEEEFLGDDGDQLSPPSLDSGIVYSLSNNPLTSRLIKRNQAKKLAESLRKDIADSKNPAKRELEYLIAADRFARTPMSEIVQTAKRLVSMELTKGINSDISDSVKLELALAGIQARNYAFAELFLDDISKSKDPLIRAAVANAYGVIALVDDRIPEAVKSFREALRAKPGYDASQLNLGFIALQYGNFEFAKKMLNGVQGDWFADSGSLVAARLTQDAKTTESLCQKLLARKKPHKPTLFNCGVHQWQSNRNIEKARELMDKALGMKGGPDNWLTEGEKTLSRVKQ